MNYTIARVTRDQFPDWIRMRELLYSGVDRAFHEQEMNSILNDEEKLCLIACPETGAPCAMAEVSLRNIVDGCLTSPVGYLEGLFVDSDHRHQGLSKRLLSNAEAWCRDWGCQELATDAELENVAAQRFHVRMGFQETYRIVEYRKSL